MENNLIAVLIGVMLVAAAAAYAVVRGRRHARAARSRSMQAEAFLEQTAREISVQRPPMSPEEIERRAKVAAAFGGEVTPMDQFGQQVPQPSLWPASLPVAKPPVPPSGGLPLAPPAAGSGLPGFAASMEANYGGDKVAARLRQMASQVEVMTAPGSATTREEILVYLAREWANLQTDLLSG